MFHSFSAASGASKNRFIGTRCAVDISSKGHEQGCVEQVEDFRAKICGLCATTKVFSRNTASSCYQMASKFSKYIDSMVQTP